jgi:hypothetical protein
MRIKQKSDEWKQKASKPRILAHGFRHVVHRYVMRVLRERAH